MWSSTKKSNSGRKVSSSSFLFPKTPTRRTMEEVWKDISCTTNPTISSHNGNGTSDAIASPPGLRGIVLQDFLAGPLNRPISKPTHLGPPPPPPPAAAISIPPPTVLSLSSSLEFRFDGIRSYSHGGNNGREACTDCTTNPNPGGSGHLFSFCSRKRREESPPDAINPGERSNKRMIRNRESAARSRARKQAYTNGLEVEVAHLLEQNARLKKQYDELSTAMAAQIPTKNTPLQRSSSSPI